MMISNCHFKFDSNPLQVEVTSRQYWLKHAGSALGVAKPSLKPHLNPITKNLNPTIVWKDGSCLLHQELRNKNHSLTGQKRTVHSRGLQNLKKD